MSSFEKLPTAAREQRLDTVLPRLVINGFQKGRGLLIYYLLPARPFLNLGERDRKVRNFLLNFFFFFFKIKSKFTRSRKPTMFT